MPPLQVCKQELWAQAQECDHQVGGARCCTAFGIVLYCIVLHSNLAKLAHRISRCYDNMGVPRYAESTPYGPIQTNYDTVPSPRNIAVDVLAQHDQDIRNEFPAVLSWRCGLHVDVLHDIKRQLAAKTSINQIAKQLEEAHMREHLRRRLQYYSLCNRRARDSQLSQKPDGKISCVRPNKPEQFPPFSTSGGRMVTPGYIGQQITADFTRRSRMLKERLMMITGLI